jgi:dolichyl-phosphate-mannose-protein mannosyltransferase
VTSADLGGAVVGGVTPAVGPIRTDAAVDPPADAPPAAVRVWWRPAVGPVVAFVASVAVLAPGLGSPRVFVFDEAYYAQDALDLLQHGVEGGGAVHPPLGKWLIAAGIRTVGFTPVGWRLAALVAVAATVAATYVGARVLARRTTLAVAAAVLALTDGILFTSGRVALLDGFVAWWVTVALVGSLWVRERGFRPGSTVRPKVLLGLVLGAAVATKWSAALVVPVVALALLDADRRLVPPGPPRRRAFVETAVAVVAIPVAVYAVVAIPFLVQAERTPAGIERCGEVPDCSLSPGARIDAWWDTQWSTLQFHRALRPRNGQAAPAWTWVAQTQPTALFDETCEAEFDEAPPELDDGVCDGAAPGDRALVVAVGNPVLWVTATIAGLGLAVRAVRRSDTTAALLLVAGLVQWLPWAFGARSAFSFYAAPIVPVLTWWWVWWAHTWRRGPAVLAVVALAAAVAFVVLHPILVGDPLGRAALGRRLWWSSWP